jgi:putative ABC transport system substrate-binding protein
MKRRQFIAGAAGAAVSVTAHAQPRGSVARIGFLSPIGPPDRNLESFRQGMRALGYLEGRNFALEVRYAHRDYRRFQGLVQELIAAKVDLIVTSGAATRGAPFAAQSVPVVFGFSGDPVDAGIVASFARPGGNATGISLLSLELAAKRVEMIKELAPGIRRIAVLSNPEHPGDASEERATREAAERLGLQTRHFPVANDASFEAVFDAIAGSDCNALITQPDALTLFHRAKIGGFALSHRLPSMFGWRDFTEAGGLISYGPIRDLSARRLAYFADKILHGAKPADLPVEQPITLELVVNLGTARKLGLTIPQTFLARADEVIE